MLRLEFQEYFSHDFCPLVLGTLLISEVTGIGLTYLPPCSAVSQVLCRPQAAFAGCGEGWLQVLYFSSVLLQSSQTPKLPLPRWAGSRASRIPVVVVPLHLENSNVLLCFVTWDRCRQQRLVLPICSPQPCCSPACSCGAAGANRDGEAGRTAWQGWSEALP